MLDTRKRKGFKMAHKIPFNVWRFISPSTGEVEIVAKQAYTNDESYQHEYQRIVFKCDAYTANGAMTEYKLSLV